MPNIVYNGEFALEPHYSGDLLLLSKEEIKAFIESERDRVLADKPTFEADLENENPELAEGAKNQITFLERKAEKLQADIDQL